MARPIGSQNKDKPFKELLRMLLFADEKKKLYAIANQLIHLAMAGDIQAIKEVGDRLDGRVPQILNSDRDLPMFLNVNWIATPKAEPRPINDELPALPNPLPNYQPTPNNAALEGDDHDHADPTRPGNGNGRAN